MQVHAIAGEMVVWHKQPAQRWTDASPLGNGLTAAMVFGGAKTERIALNNSSFWSGRPHDYDDPNAGQYFDQIKALMAEKKFQEAEKIVDDHFYGSPKAQQAYQPIKGGAIKVRSGPKTATITIKRGQMVHLNADLIAAN